MARKTTGPVFRNRRRRTALLKNINPLQDYCSKPPLSSVSAILAIIGYLAGAAIFAIWLSLLSGYLAILLSGYLLSGYLLSGYLLSCYPGLILSISTEPAD